jgi:hypothetical protein
MAWSRFERAADIVAAGRPAFKRHLPRRALTNIPVRDNPSFTAPSAQDRASARLAELIDAVVVRADVKA